MADPLHNEFPPDSIEAKDLKHLLHPTTNLAQHHANGPKVLTRAEGAYIWDNQGNQYLEAMAGLWCTALGYGEEELARVAYEQMKNLSYNQLFAGKTNEASVLLAEKLKAMAPMDAGRVFFGLSGSDANDTQVKLMWYYNNSVGRPEKKKIISRMRGYHGVTVASGSLTGLPPFHKHFDLPIPGILHTDCPHYYRGQEGGESESEFVDRIVGNLESLILKEGPETIAAFIAEPIMGAGGVVVPPAGYYQKVQALLKQHDILFIDDEVICGFGRTGRAFGAETFGIEPDTMSVAKAVSSAYLPLSAVLLPEFMYEAFTAMSAELGNFSHGFTYSGHPVCAAVALRNLELMEERDLFAHAARMGDLMQDRMAELADQRNPHQHLTQREAETVGGCWVRTHGGTTPRLRLFRPGRIRRTTHSHVNSRTLTYAISCDRQTTVNGGRRSDPQGKRGRQCYRSVCGTSASSTTRVHS